MGAVVAKSNKKKASLSTTKSESKNENRPDDNSIIIENNNDNTNVIISSPTSMSSEIINKFKILVLGSGGIGRTSLLLAFLGEENKSLLETFSSPSIGIDYTFGTIPIKLKKTEVKLSVHDTGSNSMAFLFSLV